MAPDEALEGKIVDQVKESEDPVDQDHLIASFKDSASEDEVLKAVGTALDQDEISYDKDWHLVADER